jgi:tetratricopeptide (TPR) repeat protein
LYQQRSKDAVLAQNLALLELPNLLAALEYLRETATPERVVGVATNIEGLMSNLGRPKTLARLVEIRIGAAQHLGAWGHAQYLAEDAAVDRLLEQGRYPEAVAGAKFLLEKAEVAGGDAYKGAAYDLATARVTLGRALNMAGSAEEALMPLEAARAQYQVLATAGDQDAARMANVVLTEKGDCLTDLGRLDEAASAYEEAIRRADERHDLRSVAVVKGQLATVRSRQRRYLEALAAYAEVRDIFKKLGEPDSVVTAWHQTGIVHTRAGQYEAAEKAYQESLKIKVQTGNRWGEAATVHELGSLYSKMGRHEEAVRLYRQAVEVCQSLKDLQKEGFTRSNVARELIRLKRCDEARQELNRAVECKQPFGHAAEPWKTFDILSDLERAVGNQPAATEARNRAIQAYLAYRRAGGESQASGGELCALVRQAIAEGQTEAATGQLQALLQLPNLPDPLKTLIPALQAILAGSRDPALAHDSNLDYDDAAELLLLVQ